MSGSDWKALCCVQEWSGGLPGCAVVVGRPSRMSVIGGDALPDDSE